MLQKAKKEHKSCKEKITPCSQPGGGADHDITKGEAWDANKNITLYKQIKLNMGKGLNTEIKTLAL